MAGCASTSPNPQYPVYTTGLDDYFVAGDILDSAATPPGANTLNHIGLYPWWSAGFGRGGFPTRPYMYYSPNFYPHYFSIWDTSPYNSYYGFRGFYGGLHPFWCPPYRRHGYREPALVAGGSGARDQAPAMPTPPAAVYRLPVNTDPDLWHSIERMSAGRDRANMSRGVPRSGAASARSAYSDSAFSATRGSYDPRASGRIMSRPSAPRASIPRSPVIRATPRAGIHKQ